ncbi:hypothetical protein RH857_07800 [Nesterenkonia flava]|uniref:Uncharacterized protein n=1 Tax=Nesterenkonia flava TaxID=469799 RepID=A0ABU1FV43_9MICC|nr:hypothetical protein [Nesterenkonia flava]MDR5712031.1 hypothetical protein [Nesterenkonia flava]
MPPSAGKVVIRHPTAVLHLLQDEPLTALAEHDRLQVVVMDPVTLADSVPGLQDALDLFEGLVVDQRLVVARIGDAVVIDSPGVIRVLQHALEGGQPQGLGGTLLGGPGGEPAVGHLLQQRSGGPASGGEFLERGGDVVCPVGVHDDSGFLVASADDSLVEVADGRDCGCAALFDFLLHALDDLVSEVAAVELSD